MNTIQDLEPRLLWQNFHALTRIPRPSKHEARALEFVENYARQLGLTVFRDKVGNVIIRQDATPGCEHKIGVILQAHIDMVPQKNNDKQHDFLTDPIETIVDGSWVRANGTTLGADDGIGVAAALAVLADKNIAHGSLEVLITFDEETGMTGAYGLQQGDLRGKILLNLDSETDGEIFIGCAGGLDVNATFKYNEVETAEEDIAFELTLSGLRGGHSGIDINLGRANANKLITRFLKYSAANFESMLSHLEGGNMRNAIPREARAVVTIDSDDKEEFIEAVEEFEDMFRSEYADVEPQLSFTARRVETPSRVIDEMTADDIINALQGCPNGPIRMSTEMPGLVETSTNLAVVRTVDGTAEVKFLIRSSVDTAKDDVASSIESIFRLAGAEVEMFGEYPGWKPNPQSAILSVVVDTYNKLYGHAPQVKAMHAGLECGVMAGIYHDWDMVSFGPTIEHPHSPDERVSIRSVGNFWSLLTSVLANIPDNK